MRFVSWSCHVNMCAWPTPCRIKCHEKGKFLLSIISESETHILYRFIKKSETFQVFISWNFDDYGLQIMKTQNSVSQNTVDQHQQMTWQPKSTLTVETSHWTSSNMDSVSLLSSSRLWDLDFQIKCKIYFYLKRGLWTTEQHKQSSSSSP